MLAPLCEPLRRCKRKRDRVFELKKIYESAQHSLPPILWPSLCGDYLLEISRILIEKKSTKLPHEIIAKILEFLVPPDSVMMNFMQRVSKHPCPCVTTNALCMPSGVVVPKHPVESCFANDFKSFHSDLCDFLPTLTPVQIRQRVFLVYKAFLTRAIDLIIAMDPTNSSAKRWNIMARFKYVTILGMARAFPEFKSVLIKHNIPFQQPTADEVRELKTKEYYVLNEQYLSDKEQMDTYYFLASYYSLRQNEIEMFRILICRLAMKLFLISKKPYKFKKPQKSYLKLF